MINDCPKMEKCPIFKQGVLMNEKTGQTYKNLYCTKPEKFKECKRYLVSEIIKKPVPENILPNSPMTVDQILQRLKS